jgi:hypothetical protein
MGLNLGLSSPRVLSRHSSYFLQMHNRILDSLPVAYVLRSGHSEICTEYSEFHEQIGFGVDVEG